MRRNRRTVIITPDTMQRAERGYDTGTLPFISDEDVPVMPSRRSECTKVNGRCLSFRCRHHLGSSPKASGNVVAEHGPDFLETTGCVDCSLDAAELGGLTLEEVGQMMGMTRERVAQIERVAMAKVRKAFPQGLDAWVC